MCTKFARRGMIGQYGYAYRFRPILNSIQDRTDKTMIEVCNRAEFELHISIVTGLIAGFDMQIDKIISLQSPQRSLYLSHVVCIVQARSTFNIDDAQPGIPTYPPDKVDSGNDGSRTNLREGRRERSHAWTISPTPRPNAIGLIRSFPATRKVQRVMRQEFLTLNDQVTEKPGRILCLGNGGLRQIWFVGFSGYIMRRRAKQTLVTTLDDQ